MIVQSIQLLNFPMVSSMLSSLDEIYHLKQVRKKGEQIIVIHDFEVWSQKHQVYSVHIHTIYYEQVS